MTHVVAVNNPDNPTIPKIRHHFILLQYKLKKILDANVYLTVGLEQTIKQASEEARQQMTPELYDAVNEEFGGKGFPTTIDEWAFDWDCFLWKSAIWIPNEEGNVWKGSDGYNQKLFDILCHFYWLINADVDVDYPLVKPQEDAHFNSWLVEYVKVNGLFLDSPESLTLDSLQSYIDDEKFNMELFIENKNDWNTFNQFFYRRFNHTNSKGMTPLRPIAEPENNAIIASPASCTFKQAFPIQENGDIEAISVKGVKVANIRDLLGLTLHAKKFYGGTFVHYFLSPYDYHRFHTPVRGKVVQVSDIPGYVYLNAVLENGQYVADDDATNGYEFIQSRGLIIIDTGVERVEPVDAHAHDKHEHNEHAHDKHEHNEHAHDEHGLNNIGLVAVIPVGMCQVSGVGLNNALDGEIVEKGREFGMFKFGGSDIIMLFEQPVDYLQLEKKHFNYGEKSITVSGLRSNESRTQPRQAHPSQIIPRRTRPTLIHHPKDTSPTDTSSTYTSPTDISPK